MLKILQISYIAILVLIITLISSLLLILSACSFAYCGRDFKILINVNLYLQKVKVYTEIIFVLCEKISLFRQYSSSGGLPLASALSCHFSQQSEFFLNLALRAVRCIRASPSIRPFFTLIPLACHTIALLRRPLSGLTRLDTNGR